VREADNLPPYSADVKKSRSLNSPRPLWACMACNGCAVPLSSFTESVIKLDSKAEGQRVISCAFYAQQCVL
jgi:hypothetical protein